MDRAKREYIGYRILEILPGSLVWITLIATVIISFVRPQLAIMIVILFDLYWLIRVSYLMLFVFLSWFKYRKTRRIDWQSRLEHEFDSNNVKHWDEYWHVIFFPTYKEPYEIPAASIRAVAASSYGRKDRMIVVVAGEERDAEHFAAVAERLQKEFGPLFHKFIVTLHPAHLENELPGKGSNLFHAGHEAKRYIDSTGIDYDKIIVSTFDVDTVANRQYFSYLTYHFLSHSNPYRVSFQPLTLYHNNIWESDIMTRVVANSTTFWLLTDLARSDRLFTFSSHSMSWRALVDVGFWQNNIVTEDSRIFLQCFMRYDGDYHVFPMYITVSMNTVYMGSLFRSLINQYKQMRRWAYGVEHFPYMVWHFARNDRIPLKKKIIYLWNQTEGVYSWATAPLIMLIMGRIPLWIADITRDTSFLTQQAPLVLSGIMTVAMWGLVCIAVMSTMLLPPRPMKGGLAILQYSVMVVQWLLFPITMIIFGSIPAIDAQTRLMLGRYLDFWVTEKRHPERTV